MSVRNAWRRADWFARGVSTRQLANGALAAASFATRRQRLRSWPVLVKVDISPVCNLHCTYCVHATPEVDTTGALAQQVFNSRQRMPLERFEALVAEIAPHTAAVALYYVGDPLVHPQLTEFCATATAAGLNSHISTNFSFHLSDARLEQLVTSGPTHLTVCVDSMRQERYERTRVGGDIGLVLRNLERLLEIRAALGRRTPKVEAQFIKYHHNVDEVDDAAQWCAVRGVDQFTEYWGHLHNYADLAPSQLDVGAPLEGELFPRCAWPWFALQLKYDGDVIPCCYHRVSEQYREGGDARAVGNVFEHGLFRVWNSAEYRRIRRLSINPARAARDDDVESSFCHGCAAVFDSTARDQERTGDAYRWEELYERTPAGAVARRADAGEEPVRFVTRGDA
jgi:MoaA/NifB/PqqE/SkfB family radical SAM enzyme